MASHIETSEQSNMAEASPFITVCQDQVRRYWSIKRMPIDPTLDKVISSALSTYQLIDTMRKSKPSAPNTLTLLDKAAAKLNAIKHIKTNGRPQIYRLTIQLRLVFVRIAADLFKTLEAEDKERALVMEEEAEEEDFVMMEN